MNLTCLYGVLDVNVTYAVILGPHLAQLIDDLEQE